LSEEGTATALSLKKEGGKRPSGAKNIQGICQRKRHERGEKKNRKGKKIRKCKEGKERKLKGDTTNA